MNRWRSQSLGELATFVNGDRSSSYPKNSDYTEHGVPFLSAADIGDGLVNLVDAKTISEEAYRRLRSGQISQGDILYCLRGSLGKIAVYDFASKAAIASSLVIIRPRSGIDRRFLYYLLSEPEFQRKSIALDNGSVQPNLSVKALTRLEAPVPPIAEQKEISAFLGTLDDKINLNRRMNETLEQTARAIFKDWFVDFGPTRAKMAGQEAYLSEDLWALFPERLDEAGVPEGWESFRLDQLAEHHKGSVTPLKAPKTIFEHYSLPAFDSGQTPVLDEGASIKSNKTVIPKGSVLLSKLNPEIPRVWLPHEPSGYPQVASTEFLAFTPKTSVGRSTLYCLFTETTFRQTLQGMVTGTSKSHQRVSPKALLSLFAALGSADLFNAFDRFAAQLLERVIANRTESKILAQTRDLLLPKLMSGELRMCDAEAQVAEVL